MPDISSRSVGSQALLCRAKGLGVVGFLRHTSGAVPGGELGGQAERTLQTRSAALERTGIQILAALLGVAYAPLYRVPASGTEIERHIPALGALS